MERILGGFVHFSPLFGGQKGWKLRVWGGCAGGSRSGKRRRIGAFCGTEEGFFFAVNGLGHGKFMFGLLELEALEGKIVHGFPTDGFGAFFGEGFDVLESTLVGAGGLGEISIGEGNAFEFGVGPRGWVGFSGMDVGLDGPLGALTAPEHPASVGEIFNKMLLFGGGRFEVVDEGVG